MAASSKNNNWNYARETKPLFDQYFWPSTMLPSDTGRVFGETTLFKKGLLSKANLKGGIRG